MNAIAPVGNRLLIRRWPASMEHQIDVDRGAKPSLWDAMPFRELAQAIGMELIAGAFVTPSNVSDASSEVEYTISPHRYLGYAPELKSWKSLGDYTVAIVGYSVDKGEEYSTLALHYADADMAERKASELEARINALSVHLYSDLGSKSDESLHFALVGTLCKSLEARTLTYTKFSVLVLDCAANDGGVGLSGRNLWDHTLTYHTLDFLIPDIDHLK